MERVQGKCTDPSGVVCNNEVYCWPCHLKHTSTAVDGDYICDPFFSTTEWGFQPKCCKCQKDIQVAVEELCLFSTGLLNFNTQPKFSLEPGKVVGHIKHQEMGEIIRWAFGTHENSYSYEVKCAEDGAIRIWHRSDISVNPECMRWK